MVRLDRITTRGGDRGETSLGDGGRVSKLDALIQAAGAVDELNAVLGWAQVVVQDPQLTRIQNELFDVGADIAVPFALADGTATGGRDYRRYSDTLQIPKGNTQALVTMVNNTFFQGWMPAAMQTEILGAVNAITGTTAAVQKSRAQAALYLALTSGLYNVEH